MAIKGSGSPLSITEIRAEFGGAAPHSLSEYYRGGGLVPNAGANNSIPLNGEVSISDYYGGTNTVTFTYVIQGAGGAGGYGRSDGGGVGRAPGGGSTTITAAGMSTATVAGGAGGLNGAYIWNNASDRPGKPSFYGPGGAGGGTNANTPGQAPASTSYGAGGGGGGSDASGTYDDDGNGGQGGRAGTRDTGSRTVLPGTVITITVGSGGYNPPVGVSQGRDGGRGAGGVAFITYNGVTTTYTAGTYTKTL